MRSFLSSQHQIFDEERTGWRPQASEHALFYYLPLGSGCASSTWESQQYDISPYINDRLVSDKRIKKHTDILTVLMLKQTKSNGQYVFPFATKKKIKIK